MIIETVSKEQFSTGLWSGGSTSQMAIFPEDASYAQRNFLWRISSATVEQEESTFTSLPEYNRTISLLQGQMILSHERQSPVCLSPFQLHCFDGGIQTTSRGKCTDFNLMTRKDRCRGQVVCHRLPAGQSMQILIEHPFTGSDHSRLILFVPGGELSLRENDKKENLHLLPEGSLTFIHDDCVSSITLQNTTSELIYFFQINIGW